MAASQTEPSCVSPSPISDVDAEVAAVRAGGESHAQPRRQAVAQRAGRHVHAGRSCADRVALEPAVQPAEGAIAPRPGSSPASARAAYRAGAGVALGEDKAVAVGPAGAGGVEAHHAKVERRHDVGGGERTARVARAAAGIMRITSQRIVTAIASSCSTVIGIHVVCIETPQNGLTRRVEGCI